MFVELITEPSFSISIMIDDGQSAANAEGYCIGALPNLQAIKRLVSSIPIVFTS